MTVLFIMKQGYFTSHFPSEEEKAISSSTMSYYNLKFCFLSLVLIYSPSNIFWSCIFLGKHWKQPLDLKILLRFMFSFPMLQNITVKIFFLDIFWFCYYYLHDLVWTFYGQLSLRHSMSPSCNYLNIF